MMYNMLRFVKMKINFSGLQMDASNFLHCNTAFDVTSFREEVSKKSQRQILTDGLS